MADSNQSDFPFLHLLQKEIPDLALGNQIQHCTDLVRQQKPGSLSKCTGKLEPLQLSA